VRPRAALAATDLGFAAFIERNRPRYTRYAQARLVKGADAADAVRSTLMYAREDWCWLLGQPSLAADVWEELRYQVRRVSSAASSRDADANTLYDRLPEHSADCVLLCHRLGLAVGEAAELMGLEIPSVQAALAVARRAFPYLAEKGARLTHL
jgi:DNA-directed RNA polymerase specialized sigma24 family protein